MSVTAQATEPQKPPEQPAATPEVPAQKPDELSSKFATLAKKEKALRAQAQALKAKEDAMKAQEADYATKYIPKERLTKETLSVLNEMGISYDQLTNMILNQPPQPDKVVLDLQREISELKNELKSHKTQTEESQTKAYDQAVNQIRNEAKLLVDSDPTFETIKDTDNTEAIVELIKERYSSEGVVMTVQEAAKEVEEYLLDEAMKMAGLKKVKEKLALVKEEVPAGALKQQSTTQPQLKTLTNNIAQITKPLTNKDRRERAIAAFKGQMK